MKEKVINNEENLKEMGQIIYTCIIKTYWKLTYQNINFKIIVHLYM